MVGDQFLVFLFSAGVLTEVGFRRILYKGYAADYKAATHGRAICEVKRFPEKYDGGLQGVRHGISLDVPKSQMVMWRVGCRISRPQTLTCKTAHRQTAGCHTGE